VAIESKAIKRDRIEFFPFKFSISGCAENEWAAAASWPQVYLPGALTG
jgi:hypothetical protein